jgi:hypothetical protein
VGAGTGGGARGGGVVVIIAVVIRGTEGSVADLKVAGDGLVEFAGVAGVVAVDEVHQGVGSAKRISVPDARVGFVPIGFDHLAGVLGGSCEFGGFDDGEAEGLPVVEGNLVSQQALDEVAGLEGAVDVVDQGFELLGVFVREKETSGV